MRLEEIILKHLQELAEPEKAEVLNFIEYLRGKTEKYDTSQERIAKRKAKEIVKRTAGIYRGIDGAAETRRLRRSWERGVWR